MKRIFLSYTYNSHKDYVAVTKEIERCARVVIDSLNLRVVDGQDLGGRALEQEIRQRIDDSDALVALITPWTDGHGNPAVPPYVNDEYSYAVAQKKEATRVLHGELQALGMYQQHEYIPLDPNEPLGAVLKLIRTISGWKRRGGSPRQVRIEPDALGEQIQQQDKPACQYQLLVENQPQLNWHDAQVWPEPGAVYAWLPRVPEESKVRMRLTLGNDRWQSEFSDLHGRIQLTRR